MPQESESKSIPASILIGVSILAGLLTLIPPFLIGTGSSALALQSLEHWMTGAPDRFEALHVHWLWIPRVIVFIAGDAFAALVIFRVLIVGLTTYLFMKTAERFFAGRTAMIGGAMLLLNATVLYQLHTFGSELLTLFMAVLLLYLLSSPNTRNHKVAALLFGLSLSIGFWPCVLLLAIVTAGLNFHHATYTPKAKGTYVLFALMVVGAGSYLLLEIFYFGTAHLWEVLNPHFYIPREINLIAQGLILSVFTANALLFSKLGRRKGELAREFQSAFVICGMFALINVFSREDILMDMMVLLPCLVLVALDKFDNIARFGGIYVALNLGLFLLLPAFTTDPEIASVKAQRMHNIDAISGSYYLANDLFSYHELLEQHDGAEEARQLLGGVHLDSTLVLVNAGTDYWFDGASLGAMFPRSEFGWFYGYPLNTIRINGLIDTAWVHPSPARPYVAGLFEKSYARTFIDSLLPQGVAIKESGRFQYIDTRGNLPARRALIDQMIHLQYQGFHH